MLKKELSKQTLHWLIVRLSGQLVAQVKLFNTSSGMQAVHSLILGPKQNVHASWQGSQVPVYGLGNDSLGQTYLHIPSYDRNSPSMQLVQLLEDTPSQVLQVR